MRIKTNIEGVRNYDWTPSVTWILSLLELDSLNEIAKLPNFEKIMKDAATRWTYMHKFIENDLQGKKVNIAKKYFDYIKQWIIYKNSQQVKVNLENSEFEKEVIKKWYLAWTIDFIQNVNWDYHIIDWKTSASKVPNKELIEKYKLQLWGYANLIGSSIGWYVEWASIVIISPKGSHTIRLDWYQLWIYEEVFNQILDLYNNIKDWREIDRTYIKLPNWMKADIYDPTKNPKKKEKIYVDVQEENRVDVRWDILWTSVWAAAASLRQTMNEINWTSELMEWIENVTNEEHATLLANRVTNQLIDNMRNVDTGSEPVDNVYQDYFRNINVVWGSINWVSVDAAIIDEAITDPDPAPEMPF